MTMAATATLRMAVFTSRSPGLSGAPARGAGVPTRGLGRLGLRALRLYWVNSGLAVGLMLLLGVGGGYEVVWKIFGSSNQLLAALTLLVGSAWLLAHGRPVWYTLVPAVFMLVTAVTAAVMLFYGITMAGLVHLTPWGPKAPQAVPATR